MKLTLRMEAKPASDSITTFRRWFRHTGKISCKYLPRFFQQIPSVATVSSTKGSVTTTPERNPERLNRINLIDALDADTLSVVASHLPRSDLPSLRRTCKDAAGATGHIVEQRKLLIEIRHAFVDTWIKALGENQGEDRVNPPLMIRPTRHHSSAAAETREIFRNLQISEDQLLAMTPAELCKTGEVVLKKNNPQASDREISILLAGSVFGWLEDIGIWFRSEDNRLKVFGAFARGVLDKLDDMLR